MKNIINVFFSRDRAMQLDATLRSFLFHCQSSGNEKVWVLYKATSKRYENQYEELIREYRGKVFFKKELDFRDDLVSILGHDNKTDIENVFSHLLFKISKLSPSSNTVAYSLWRRLVGRLLFRLSRISTDSQSKGKFIFFAVDDSLFIRNFSLKDSSNILEENEQSLGFSFRLGQNVTYSYVQNRNQIVPPLNKLKERICFFNWTTADGDFNYSLEVSSSLYRLQDILPIIMGFQFTNPNELENLLAYNARFYRKKYPLLICYENSVAFCAPVNIVQNTILNRAGENIKYNVDELANRFDEQERIDIRAYDNFVPNACHQEVYFEFMKNKHER